MTPVAIADLTLDERRDLCGTVALPSGAFPVSIQRNGMNRDQPSARLSIGKAECGLLLFPPVIAGLFHEKDVDQPSLWHGVIVIDGRELVARMVLRTRVLALFDRDQMRGKDAAAILDGEIVG